MGLGPRTANRWWKSSGGQYGASTVRSLLRTLISSQNGLASTRTEPFRRAKDRDVGRGTWHTGSSQRRPSCNPTSLPVSSTPLNPPHLLYPACWPEPLASVSRFLSGVISFSRCAPAQLTIFLILSLVFVTGRTIIKSCALRVADQREKRGPSVFQNEELVQACLPGD